MWLRFALTLLLGSVGVASVWGQHTTVIAYTGQEAPGTGGATFSSFVGLNTALHKDGRVLFKAFLSDGRSGWWLADGADFQAILVSGEPVSGLADVQWGDGDVYMDDGGRLAVVATLQSSDGRDWGVFTGAAPGNMQLVARRGQEVAPVFYSEPNDRITLNRAPFTWKGGFNNGKVVISGPRLFLQETDQGIGGQLPGWLAIGAGTDTYFSYRFSQPPGLGGDFFGESGDDGNSNVGMALNRDGQFVFVQQSNTRDQVLYRVEPDGSFEPLLSGPLGETGLDNFGAVRSLSINAEGHVGLIGKIPGQMQPGVWVQRGSSGRFISVVGISDSREVEGSTYVFNGFGELTQLAGGRVAFWAHTNSIHPPSAPNTLWIADAASQLTLVAENGTPVPGEADVRFDNIAAGSSHAINRSGQVGLISGRETCRVYLAEVGTFEELARTGDAVTVAPNDDRIIQTCFGASTSLKTPESGHQAALNDKGDFVFGVRFADDTEALVVGARAPGVLVVNTTADTVDSDASDGVCSTGSMIVRDGVEEPACSLRAAIEEANGRQIASAITFNIPTSDPGFADQVFGIVVHTPLSSIGVPVDLDATSQPDAFSIVVDGEAAGEMAQGLHLAGGNSLVRGLTLINFGQTGVQITSDNNRLEGNTIGLVGDVVRGNGSGILIVGGAGNQVGGSDDGQGNIIAGNRGPGVRLVDALDTRIIQNWIGAAEGIDNGLLGNNGAGVVIEGGSGTHMGSMVAEDANAIMDNEGDGIRIVSGVGHRVFRNRIIGNLGLGINLDDDGDLQTTDGRTRNDDGDRDSGANGLQNKPQISVVRQGTGMTRVEGVLVSMGEQRYTLEFYANPTATRGLPQAEQYLGSLDVATDATGDVHFATTFLGQHVQITAVATDAEGNSSELALPPFIVNTVADDADTDPGDGVCQTGESIDREGQAEPACSLRAAIQEANRFAGPDVITFDIPGAGPHLHALSEALPELIEAVYINGASQNGFASGHSVVHLKGEQVAGAGLVVRVPDVVLEGLRIEAFSGYGILAQGGVDGPAVGVEGRHLDLVENSEGGLFAEGDVHLSGVVRALQNGERNAAGMCTNAQAQSGIDGRGAVHLETIESRNNCGHGVRAGEGVHVSQGIQATSNRLSGVTSMADVELLGEGHTIADNGFNGIHAEHGGLVVTGRLVVERNNWQERSFAACAPPSPRHGGIVVRDDVMVAEIVVRQNCGSGIIAQLGSITVDGNAQVLDNFDSGIRMNVFSLTESALRNGSDLTLRGTQHEISGNGKLGLFAPGGSVIIEGKVELANNGGRVDPSIQLSHRLGAIRAEGIVEAEDVVVVANAVGGISASDAVRIRGDAQVSGNGAHGIRASREVELNGSMHDVSRNGRAGLTAAIIRVTGRLTANDNHRHYREVRLEDCEPRDLRNVGTTLAAIVSSVLLEVEQVFASNNCGAGINAAVVRAQNVYLRHNLADGVIGRHVFLQGGSIVGNGGYGVFIKEAQTTRTGSVEQASRWDVRAARIAENAHGGIRRPGNTTELAAKSKVAQGAPSYIRGSIIEDNGGPGIEAIPPLVIVQSSITNNAGGGVLNRLPVSPIVTDDVWWGQSTGPVAERDISAGVEVQRVRTTPVGLVAWPAADTLQVLPGMPDTTALVMHHWQQPGAVVSVTVDDNEGWVTPFTDEMITLSDSLGTRLPLVMHPAASNRATNRVHYSIALQSDPSMMVRDSFVVQTYQPELAQLVVTPDSVVVPLGTSVRFGATGLDQANQTFPVQPLWEATGGAIDSSGLYTAGVVPGVYRVLARVPANTAVAQAVVYIPDPNAVGREQAAGLPTRLALHASYPNPFQAATHITFALPRATPIRIAVYDILGRQVGIVTEGVYEAGEHSIVFAPSGWAAGMYLYALETPEARLVKTLIYQH